MYTGSIGGGGGIREVGATIVSDSKCSAYVFHYRYWFKLIKNFT